MNRFKDILCVVKLGNSLTPALERAIALAENNQAKLTVAEIVPQVTAGIGMPPGGPISDDLQAALVSGRLAKLNELLAPHRKHLSIETRILVGTAFLEVAREVQSAKYDLVIKAPDANDWLDRLFGSNDMHLLRKCPSPVWMTKPQVKTKYQRILAAVDLGTPPSDELALRNELNRKILELSSSLALSEFAELHIVYVWPPIDEVLMDNLFAHATKESISEKHALEKRSHEKAMQTFIDSLLDQLGSDTHSYLNPQAHLIEGKASKEIPALAGEIKADLVVMGTVARTGIPGFIMGNTAETILSQIDCSVLAIKPPGFVSPVTLDAD